MNRSLMTLFVLALAASTSFAQNLSNDQEGRLLKLAEQRVFEVLQDRPELLGQLPHISGSAVIDGDHVQVDAYYVKNGAVVPQTEERFIFTVSSDHVESVGAPHGEVAVVPHSPIERATSDAVARFTKVHPGTGAGIPDGTAPRVKSTRAEGGKITIVCESFGGIAGMWMGDGISYTYNSDGIYVDQSQH